MITFSNICGINGKFYIKFEHNLCIIKINECLVAKNLLTNVTKTNEHSNVTTFVHALHCMITCYSYTQAIHKYWQKTFAKPFTTKVFTIQHVAIVLQFVLDACQIELEFVQANTKSLQTMLDILHNNFMAWNWLTREH